MASRREFVRGGLALAATAAAPFTLPLAGRAASLGPSARARGAPLVVVADRSLREAEAFLAEAAALGSSAYAFESDAAAVWMNEIEPRLRAGSLAIAGLTGPGMAFCLEHMAQAYRARPLARVELEPGADARLATLLANGAAARSALPPLAHVASSVRPPLPLCWLLETRG